MNPKELSKYKIVLIFDSGDWWYWRIVDEEGVGVWEASFLKMAFLHQIRSWRAREKCVKMLKYLESLDSDGIKHTIEGRTL